MARKVYCPTILVMSTTPLVPKRMLRAPKRRIGDVLVLQKFAGEVIYDLFVGSHRRWTPAVGDGIGDFVANARLERDRVVDRKRSSRRRVRRRDVTSSRRAVRQSRAWLADAARVRLIAARLANHSSSSDPQWHAFCVAPIPKLLAVCPGRVPMTRGERVNRFNEAFRRGNRSPRDRRQLLASDGDAMSGLIGDRA